MASSGGREIRPARPESELREVALHLGYEVRMLLMTDLLLLREQEHPLDRSNQQAWTIHNALLEAHTIHSRSLFDFFFKGPDKPLDARAGDFVAGWKLKRPKPSAVLATVSSRVGQEIAHLTYGRLAYKNESERVWPNWKITDDIVTVLNAFLMLAPGYAGEAIVQQLADYHGRLSISEV